MELESDGILEVEDGSGDGSDDTVDIKSADLYGDDDELVIELDIVDLPQKRTNISTAQYYVFFRGGGEYFAVKATIGFLGGATPVMDALSDILPFDIPGQDQIANIQYSLVTVTHAAGEDVEDSFTDEKVEKGISGNYSLDSGSLIFKVDRSDLPSSASTLKNTWAATFWIDAQSERHLGDHANTYSDSGLNFQFPGAPDDGGDDGGDDGNGTDDGHGDIDEYITVTFENGLTNDSTVSNWGDKFSFKVLIENNATWAYPSTINVNYPFGWLVEYTRPGQLPAESTFILYVNVTSPEYSDESNVTDITFDLTITDPDDEDMTETFTVIHTVELRPLPPTKPPRNPVADSIGALITWLGQPIYGALEAQGIGMERSTFDSIFGVLLLLLIFGIFLLYRRLTKARRLDKKRSKYDRKQAKKDQKRRRRGLPVATRPQGQRGPGSRPGSHPRPGVKGGDGRGSSKVRADQKAVGKKSRKKTPGRGGKKGKSYRKVKAHRGSGSRSGRPGAQARPRAEGRPGAQARPRAEVRPGAQARPRAEVRPGAQARPRAEVRPGVQARPRTEGRAVAEARPRTESRVPVETRDQEEGKVHSDVMPEPDVPVRVSGSEPSPAVREHRDDTRKQTPSASPTRTETANTPAEQDVHIECKSCRTIMRVFTDVRPVKVSCPKCRMTRILY